MKNADTLMSKTSGNKSKKFKTTHESPEKVNTSHKLPVKSSIRPNTGIGKKVRVKKLYDRIYDEKMASHF